MYRQQECGGCNFLPFQRKIMNSNRVLDKRKKRKKEKPWKNVEIRFVYKDIFVL